jgi:hypothetical protein
LIQINAKHAGILADRCVYRIFDSAWTQRTEGVSSRRDEGSVQADSRHTGFALQVESKAGPKIRDEILEDATALGGMGFSPILGSATVAGSPATGSEGDFLSSGLAILKV